MFLSRRLAKARRGSGRVGARICWVKIDVNKCDSVYFVNVYMPHRGRQQLHEDTVRQLEHLVAEFDDSARVVVMGDLNARLGRNENQPDAVGGTYRTTGKWSVHAHTSMERQEQTTLGWARRLKLTAISTL